MVAKERQRESERELDILCLLKEDHCTTSELFFPKHPYPGLIANYQVTENIGIRKTCQTMYQRDTISKIPTEGHYRTNGLVSSVSKLKEKNRDRTGISILK